MNLPVHLLDMDWRTIRNMLNFVHRRRTDFFTATLDVNRILHLDSDVNQIVTDMYGRNITVDVARTRFVQDLLEARRFDQIAIDKL